MFLGLSILKRVQFARVEPRGSYIPRQNYYQIFEKVEVTFLRNIKEDVSVKVEDSICERKNLVNIFSSILLLLSSRSVPFLGTVNQSRISRRAIMNRSNNLQD